MGCRILVLAVVSVFALPTGAAFADSREDLASFVGKLPRDSIMNLPMYWMEMESIIGWEKMMLVFGYASNGPVCDRLVQVAKADAPERNFRCVSAN